MLIKLIIITLIGLPNGLYKRTVEEVQGYNNLAACIVDKDAVNNLYKSNTNKRLLSLTVSCVVIGEM
jgi:hypothetical protein